MTHLQAWLLACMDPPLHKPKFLNLLLYEPGSQICIKDVYYYYYYYRLEFYKSIYRDFLA
jgi:hypothetical protein